MTEPVIVHLEEFHLNEIFQDPLPQEDVAALLSFRRLRWNTGKRHLRLAVPSR